MPTPSLTRVRVFLPSSQWTSPTGQEVYHNAAVPPDNNAVEVQGAIAFRSRYPPEATLLSDPASEVADNKPNDHNYGPLVAYDRLTPIPKVLGREDGARGHFGRALPAVVTRVRTHLREAARGPQQRATQRRALVERDRSGFRGRVVEPFSA